MATLSSDWWPALTLATGREYSSSRKAIPRRPRLTPARPRAIFRWEGERITERLATFAALLEFADVNPYTARAYRRAAETSAGYPSASLIRADRKGARAARDRSRDRGAAARTRPDTQAPRRVSALRALGVAMASYAARVPTREDAAGTRSRSTASTTTRTAAPCDHPGSPRRATGRAFRWRRSTSTRCVPYWAREPWGRRVSQAGACARLATRSFAGPR